LGRDLSDYSRSLGAQKVCKGKAYLDPVGLVVGILEKDQRGRVDHLGTNFERITPGDSLEIPGKIFVPYIVPKNRDKGLATRMYCIVTFSNLGIDYLAI